MQYIKRKSLLYESKVEFEDYALNHIEGCIHNCQYPCYARRMKKKSQDEWQNIKIVENALEILKMRGEGFKKKIVKMDITPGKGIVIYPDKTITGTFVI